MVEIIELAESAVFHYTHYNESSESKSLLVPLKKCQTNEYKILKWKQKTAGS